MSEDRMSRLTDCIIARTSGAPCARVREVACAFVDGSLAAPRAEWVALHLARCAACANLVRTLHAAVRLLPTIAVLEADPWRTVRVMRACREAGRARSSAWLRLLMGPRVALELALAGAALLSLLILSGPVAPAWKSATHVAPGHALAGALSRGLRRMTGTVVPLKASAPDPGEPSGHPVRSSPQDTPTES